MLAPLADGKERNNYTGWRALESTNNIDTNKQQILST